MAAKRKCPSRSCQSASAKYHQHRQIGKTHEIRSKKALKHARGAAARKANCQMRKATDIINRLNINSQDKLSVAERVFNITELAERILSNLGVKDTFRASGINRDIKSAILGSSMLRQRLFLDSDNGPHDTWVFDRANNKVVQLPLAPQDITADMIYWRFAPTACKWVDIACIAPKRLNTLLFKHHINARVKRGCICCQMRRCLGHDREGLTVDVDRISFRFPNLQSAAPSFDDMYLNLPPATHVEIACYNPKRPPSDAAHSASRVWKSRTSFKVHEENGVKFGDVRRAMVKLGLAEYAFQAVQFGDEAPLYEPTPIKFGELREDFHATDEEWDAMYETGRVQCWMCSLFSEVPVLPAPP